jgi:hypothetical protein
MKILNFHPTIFITAFTLPELLLYFGFASSQALGTSIFCGAIAIYIYLLIKTKKIRFETYNLYPVKNFVIVFLIIIIHLLFVYFFKFMVTIDFERGISSIAIFTLIYLASYFYSIYIVQLNKHNFEKKVMQAFKFMCFLGLLALAGLSIPGINASTKPIFPFVEPSHFALSFLPLLLFASLSKSVLSKYISLILGVIYAMAFQNLTLILGCLIVMLVSFKINRIIIIVFSIIVLIKML